jgi:hypothetical protein
MEREAGRLAGPQRQVRGGGDAVAAVPVADWKVVSSAIVWSTYRRVAVASGTPTAKWPASWSRAGEHRRPVEAREAQPVHRAGAADQRR